MKFTNAELLTAVPHIKVLIEERLPVAVSYKLVKTVLLVEEQLKAVETSRKALVKTHGTADELGNISVSKEAQPAFQAEWDELMGFSVDLDVEAVKLPEKINGEDFNIAPQTLMGLSRFIEV